MLPVLWMTPYFHIMGIMARLGGNDMGAVLKQVVQISNVFARVATQPTLFDFIVVYNGSNNCPVLLFVTLLFFVLSHFLVFFLVSVNETATFSLAIIFVFMFVDWNNIQITRLCLEQQFSYSRDILVGASYAYVRQSLLPVMGIAQLIDISTCPGNRQLTQRLTSGIVYRWRRNSIPRCKAGDTVYGRPM